MILKKHVEMIVNKTIEELKLDDFLTAELKKIADITESEAAKIAGLTNEGLEERFVDLSDNVFNLYEDLMEENIDDLSEKVKAEVIEWYEEFCSDEE